MSRITLNPPLQRIPEKLRGDREVELYLENLNTQFEQIYRYLQSGTVVLGDTFSSSSAAFLAGVINQDDFDFISAQSNHETCGKEIILASDGVTITLNSEPDDQEIVVVNSFGGLATVDGNGRNISGQTTHSIIERYTTLAFVYLCDSDEWVLTQSAHPETQQRLAQLRIDGDQLRIDVDQLRVDVNTLIQGLADLTVVVNQNAVSIGDLSQLLTTDKTNLVSAMNELFLLASS